MQTAGSLSQLLALYQDLNDPVTVSPMDVMISAYIYITIHTFSL